MLYGELGFRAHKSLCHPYLPLSLPGPSCHSAPPHTYKYNQQLSTTTRHNANDPPNAHEPGILDSNAIRHWNLNIIKSDEGRVVACVKLRLHLADLDPRHPR